MFLREPPKNTEVKGLELDGVVVVEAVFLAFPQTVFSLLPAIELA